jgi:RNA polymerase sigma factor (sigma-70 family)
MSKQLQPFVKVDAQTSEPDLDRSFEDFFQAESDTLFRRMWLVCGDPSEAEEVVQDSFVRIWERWERVQRIEDPKAYLYRTAMNVFRSRYRRGLLALRRAVSQVQPRDDFAAADARETVRRALATLTPRQRAAIVMTELLGFSSSETGRILGIRPGTVRALASQGRAAFRELAEDDDA